jgi:predicted pyridoxine 5'-phosphate oxidase superfamily flavin-nucleotide-binding protein
MTDTPSSDLAFTPAVKREQEKRGSRAQYERVEAKGGFRTAITDDLRAFVAERDSFYLSTASATGRPYIQHRGGPKGFLRAIDDRTLAFPDFAGNKQYITLGNLAENDQAFIFLMDYALQQRVKLWGRARVVEATDEPALTARLRHPDYRAKIERVVLFTVEAWDSNCRQHILPRYDEATVARLVAKMTDRIEELEAEVAGLRRRLAGQ